MRGTLPLTQSIIAPDAQCIDYMAIGACAGYHSGAVMRTRVMRTRGEALRRIEGAAFDVCIVGGGATGAGCALDAQLRGLRTVLVEGADFASGSSSASTKMTHGGVRYLQEAVHGLDFHQYRLVEHALRERARMLRNASYLARPIEFTIPCFGRFEQFYYAAGMKMYDWIAGQPTSAPASPWAGTKPCAACP